jgi:hypothetical protein
MRPLPAVFVRKAEGGVETPILSGKRCTNHDDQKGAAMCSVEALRWERRQLAATQEFYELRSGDRADAVGGDSGGPELAPGDSRSGDPWTRVKHVPVSQFSRGLCGSMGDQSMWRATLPSCWSHTWQVPDGPAEGTVFMIALTLV